MWAAIIIVAAPVLLQQTMTACVGLVDKMLSGSLPDTIVVPAMDAIGIGSYLTWFLAIAMSGLGIGGQAIIARAMGSGDLEDGSLALGSALGISLAWGALVGLGMWLAVDPICKFAGLQEEALEYCRSYVGMIALGMPFCGVMMVGSMCLHGAGETLRPSLISIGVNLVNVGASWFFSGIDLQVGQMLLENPSWFDPEVHGVTGIAGGTTASFAFGGISIFIVMIIGVKDLKLDVRKLMPRLLMFWRILRVGVPNFIEGTAMWSANLFVMMFIGMIAVAESVDGVPMQGLVGAHVIAIQWEAFSFLPGFAMGTAAAALAGQYLGAKNPAMARRAIVRCVYVGMIMMGTLGLAFIFFGEQLTRVISDEPVYLDRVPDLLLICGLIQVFFALNMIIRQALRGVGDTRWTLLITVVSTYGIRLPAAWFLGVYMGMGLTGIWIGLCGELVVRGCLFTARFLHGGWQRIQV